MSLEAIVFDVDGGLKGVTPTAEYVGKKILLEQLPFHLRTFLKGYKGLKRVRATMKEYGEEGAAYGLQKFFEVMGETVDLDFETLYRLTENVLRNKEIPGFSEFNLFLQKKGIRVFLATIGYDTVGYVGLKVYNISGFAANPIVWSSTDGRKVHGKAVVYRNLGDSIEMPPFEVNTKVNGCLIPIKNSADKERLTIRLLDHLDINPENVAVVGNDFLDHESMKTLGLAIASPVADNRTVELANNLGGIHIEDYMNAHHVLRKYL